MNDSGSGCGARDRRHTLAEFLKAKRGSTAPGLFALPSPARRRVSGLRREEVALLCGISTTWYTQLEAGTPITVSPALLSRLADVLQMSALERAYLFAMAIEDLHGIVAYLPPLAAPVARIAATTFAGEIEQVLRIHRSLKMQIYGALVNDTIDVLRPSLDESRCPIGYWLHDDLGRVRRDDSSYERAARAHAAFHREIERIVCAYDAAGCAAAERLVLTSGTYAAASEMLESEFAGWPRSIAS